MEFYSDLPALPKGWVWTRIGEITDNVENVNPKTNPDRKFLYIDIASIDNKLQKITNPKKYYGKNAPSRARQLIISGDILFSTVRTYLKNIAVVNDIFDGHIASTGFCVIRALPQIHNRYIFCFVQTNFFLNPLNQLQRGTSYPAVRDSDIFSQVIPLPPLPEQHRIVNKIEELFTKLDTGVDALKKIKIQLKRYRQAVLKNAFEGKLTQQWREAHKGDLESASVLLEKIKEQRKKEPKGKLKELPPIDTSELPELPEGWIWTRVGDVLEVVRGASPRPKGDPRYFGGNIPWIMISDTSKENGKYISKTKDTVTEVGAAKSRYLKAGTLILSNSGTVCVPKILAVNGCIHDGFVAFPEVSDEIEILYFYYFFEYVRPKIIQQNKQGVTQVNLNTDIVRNIEIQLPPREEQHQIVAEIESRLSVVDQLEKVVEQSLKQAERLRQSILKQAFEGKLVPQDPTDEPAEKLLERIKKEKESKGLAKQKSGKRK
jgi:type I restriction enzyme S subunit